MLEIVFDYILFNTLGSLSAFFVGLNVYILDRNPMNSTVGVPATSSLNFPMTFLLFVS